MFDSQKNIFMLMFNLLDIKNYIGIIMIIEPAKAMRFAPQTGGSFVSRVV